MMIPDKLLINLKIISKIQKNGRIARSYDGIISLENDVFYQSVKRFVSNDSRRQAIFEINSVITECVEILHHILNSKHMNKNFCQSDEYIKACENIHLILQEMELAKAGVDNLKFTYQNDPNIVSQIDIIILKINTTLKDISQKLIYFQSFLPNHQYNSNMYYTNANTNTTNQEINSIPINNVVDNSTNGINSTSYQNSYQELNNKQDSDTDE
jgi:hypothetical protein